MSFPCVLSQLYVVYICIPYFINMLDSSFSCQVLENNCFYSILGGSSTGTHLSKKRFVFNVYSISH